jgi:hypothetical protein
MACDYAPMKARHFYLICCVLGLLLPYSQFVPWLLEHGLNFALFCRELFANRISAFFAMDVIVSAIVLIWFIQGEGNVCGSGFFGCQLLEHWLSAYHLDCRFFFF